MPDNTKQTGEDTIATDEISSGVASGAKVQRVKIGVGKDGEYNDVSSEAPLPIGDAGGSLTVDSPALGVEGDAEATGNGSIIGLLKRLRKLLEGTGVIKVSKVEEALPAGTNAIGKLAANSGVDIGDVDVTSLTGGVVAHDGADSGNPIKVGGRARTALEAVSAQNDRSDLILDKFGRTMVAPAPLDQRFSATLNRTTTESGQLLTAVENVAYVVTAITVVNAHATVGTKVEILDGKTVKWKGYAGALGGGFSIADPNGLFVGTKNTELAAKNVTTGADVDINVSAYKIPA